MNPYIEAARAEGAETWEQICLVLDGWLQEADPGYCPGFTRAKARMNGTKIEAKPSVEPIVLRPEGGRTVYDGSSKFTNY